MLRKMCMNVVFLCCVISLSAVGAIICPPLAGAQGLALDLDRGVESLSVPAADQGGVDSYTKLMLHADGSDQGTSFTDSSSGAKTVTNTESYDSYTKLMLHIENNVIDSAAGKTVTNNNATFSSSAYKMGGYSGVFNGSNAYLSLPNSNDFDFGSGDFTIDFWIYINGTQVGGQSGLDVGIINFGNTAGAPTDTNWVIYFQSTTGIKFLASTSGTDWDVIVDFTGISTGTWLHLAVVRTGNDYKTFTNGVLGNTVTVSGAIQDINSPLEIGRWVRTAATHYFNGWIDELRISKGIARWTSNFTPPTSPYGKVATVTSQKKFGTASGEFKGSGEYLSLADSDDWSFGNGDFTIDFWVRFNVLPSITAGMFEQQNGTPYGGIHLFLTNVAGQYQWRWRVYTASGDEIVNVAKDTTVVANTWYHIACVRTGNTWKIFQDGTQVGTDVIDSDAVPDSAGLMYIGTYDTTSYPLNGYIDEFRISKGIARWTSNFTPPSTPYETDTTVPTVSSTSPASSATGVGVSTAISATFSEDMDSSTITTSTFTLSGSSGNSISGSSIRQAQDRSVGWVKRSAPNETEDDEDGFWKANPPPDPLQRGTIDGFASLNPSYTKNAFTPTSSSVSGTVSYSNKTATFTPSSNLSYSTTYTATITTGVKDVAGNAMSSNYTWSFTTSSAPDTTAPTGSVSGASYTNSSTVTLTLSATDTTGVIGYYLSDSSTTPSVSSSGWTSVTSTTSYSGTVSYSLSSGEGSKTIYVWYKDAAGNVSSTANTTITYDTTVPTVTISSPTTSSTYTATSSTISLGGSASDSSSGISSVSWSNNRGGNGTATGTASWTVSGISLSSGDNIITVTAKDGAGNSGTDTLQVTYGTSSTVSAPTASTGSASSVTTSSATLNGTVNANGASTTAWFQYGTTSGSYGNTSSTQTATGSSNTTVSIGISGLSSGAKYYYRIAASNSGGTSYGSESSFTTSTASATPTPSSTPNPSDTTAPTVTIASPTSSSTYTTTSSAITLSGTASDNSGSVSSVTWSNSKGGSGTASGTASWTISSISLSAGDNVITVTATDGSGNSGTDTITVTYHVTTTPTPTAAPTATTTPKPSPTAQPTPIPQGSPTATPAVGSGSVSGNVEDEEGNDLEGVTVTIVGANGSSPKENGTETDSSGYYEFGNLTAGNYTLTYEKDGYQTKTKSITLGEGEEKDIGTTVLEEEGALGKIYGYVVDIKGNPLESVKLKLKGLKTGVKGLETSDGDGFFEFEDLGADKYILTAQKKRYRKSKKTITLEEGESRDIEIEMRKTSKRMIDERQTTEAQRH